MLLTLEIVEVSIVTAFFSRHENSISTESTALKRRRVSVIAKTLVAESALVRVIHCTRDTASECTEDTYVKIRKGVAQVAIAKETSRSIEALFASLKSAELAQ